MRTFSGRKAGKTALILCVAMVLGGCGSSAEETETVEEETAVTVSTQTVGTGNITLSNSFVGTISPEETVMVIPMAAGTVTETFFEPGDSVNAGDVLFKIDDEAARLQLEMAELGALSAQQTADSTRTKLINQEESMEQGFESSRLSTQGNYETAQIGYVQAKDAYKKADDACDEAKEKLSILEKRLEDAKKSLSALQTQTRSLSEEEEAQTADAAADGSSDAKEKKESDAAQAQADNNDAAQADDKEAALKEAQATVAGLEQEVNGMKSAVEQLEKVRDQAYSAYLSAKSGYHLAEEGKDIADEAEEMNREQLQDTVADTEEQLQTSLKNAELTVEQAAMALSYYTVTAPVSGIIESKNVDVNGMATQSSPAYTIVNNDTMTAIFQVSEAVKNTLSVGQPVSLERSGNTYQASITEIGSSVNQQTGLFQIKACVEADGSQLPSGVSVKITADTYQAANVLTIPYDSVYYENEGAYVYTSVDGRAVKTPITTGIFDDETIEVTGGLKAGDIVVTSWSPQLTEGVLLHAVETETEKPAESEEE